MTHNVELVAHTCPDAPHSCPCTDRLEIALYALWDWTVLHGIERHAEDGDTIASAIVNLVRNAFNERSMDEGERANGG